jgi:hypothetical protein
MAAAQTPEVQPTIVDPGSTQPAGIEPVTEPAVEPTAEPVADDQAVAEDAGPTSRPLFTESRKILAIIGGLVFVALALTLLTVRYWRITKPVPLPVDDPPSAVDAAALDPADAPLFIGDLDPPLAPITTEVPSVAAADHRPDATWEPRGTGEHAAIRVAAEEAATASGASSSSAGSSSTIARPGRAARRAALAAPSAAPIDEAGTDAIR